MKLILLVAILLLSACTVGIASSPTEPIIEDNAYYVSPKGDDSAAGTFNQPFRTIQHCAEVVQAGESCIMRKGVYREEVRPANSGSAASPITFKPYPGESVTISGAEVLTGWTHDTGHVYYANMDWDLGAGNNQVFVDGKMMVEARWPNMGLDPSKPKWATSHTVEARGAGWLLETPALPKVKEAYINLGIGQFGYAWEAQSGRAKRVDNNHLEVQAIGKSFSHPLVDGSQYFVWGARSLLDTPGEWFYDSAKHRLYLWLPDSGNPEDHKIEAKKRTLAFDLRGRSNVHLQKLNIFGATVFTDEHSSEIVLKGLNVTYPSHFTLVTQPVSQGRGDTGIVLHGHDNTLEDSIIAYSAGNGVTLNGSGQTVKNNIIHDVGYAGTDTAAVTMACTSCSGESSGHLVAYNTLYNAGRSILLARKVGSSRILYNDMSHAGLQMDDLGIVYTFKTDGEGTEIAYNLIHDNEAEDNGFGIYIDKWSSNFIVHHNVVWSVEDALRLNMPSTNNLVINNTLLGNRYSVNAWGTKYDLTGIKVYNNIAPDGIHNVKYGARLKDNLVSQNPSFQNPEKHDFTLRSGSPAIDNGLVLSPYTDGFEGSAPDLGAYEYGSEAWTAGADLPMLDQAASP
jgi:hypothetical protein